MISKRGGKSLNLFFLSMTYALSDETRTKQLAYNVGGLGVSLKCEHKTKLKDAN